MLDKTKMSEAEVSLRLAIFLIRNKLISSDVTVAIDGAQIKTLDQIHFPIEDFLAVNHCIKIDSDESWRGTYKITGYHYYLHINSNPGSGDVVTELKNGKFLRVESKKGNLQKKSGSKEYPLIREAIGQLVTIDDVKENDILAVAVPNSNKFKELITRWRNAPLINKLKLCFLLINRDGSVDGIDHLNIS